MENQIRFMQRALDIAEKGIGRVSPNPPVGCVLVRNNRIIAEGWHNRIGDLHAEQAAIADAEMRGENTEGCIAYVTLEPCNHFGRTPPCTQALLWAGVSKVVIASRDPNPNVRGKGIDALLAAGVEVDIGILENDAIIQMQSFLNWCQLRRPLVTIKMAVGQVKHLVLFVNRQSYLKNLLYLIQFLQEKLYELLALILSQCISLLLVDHYPQIQNFHVRLRQDILSKNFVLALLMHHIPLDLHEDGTFQERLQQLLHTS